MQAAKSNFGRLVTLLALTACAHNPPPNPFASAERVASPVVVAQERRMPLLKLAFSSHVMGEVGQCGCAVNPKGGVDRRLNFVQNERASSNGAAFLSVDAGNALFASQKLDPSLSHIQKKKAAFILKSHALMGIGAENVGYLDLSAGLKFLRQQATTTGVPLVSTNLLGPDGKPAFDTERAFDLPDGLKVTVLGVTLGDDALPDGLTASDPKAALRSKMAEIPLDRLVVVLSDLGQGMDVALAQEFTRPTIIVGARDLGSYETPIQKGQSLLVQPQIQGQQWGLLTFVWNSRGEGWFNPELARRYSERWTVLARDPANQESLDEMLLYAPGNVAQKSVYEHHLVDMNIAYSAKNELTNGVKEYGKAPSDDRMN